MKNLSSIRVCKEILFPAFLVGLLVGCKKEATKPSPPPYIASMEGDHSWVGKKYSPQFDSSALYYDSSDVTFTNHIHVLDGNSIVVNPTYVTNNVTNDTMTLSFLDTIGKLVCFESRFVYSYGHNYETELDSLVYNYSDSTFVWYESDLVDGLTTLAWLHSR